MVYAFDCLYLNGESLLHKPLSERRAAMHGALIAKEGQLDFATAKTSRDVEELAVGGRGGGGLRGSEGGRWSPRRGSWTLRPPRRAATWRSWR
jgi:hypothetical protein